MHLRLRKCEKSPQTYRKLADLRLRNTSCSFAEFSVAELSVNLRCPALHITLKTELQWKLIFVSKSLQQRVKVDALKNKKKKLTQGGRRRFG